MSDLSPSALSALRVTVTERFAVPSHARAAFQVANSVAVLLASWWLALWALEFSSLLALAFTFPIAGASIRLFIFQHDCGHGAFLSSQRANDILGSILGVITLTPYHYWKRTHATHHATSGNLEKRGMGDLETLTVKEYQALTKWQQLGYRLYRNPVVLLGIGAMFHFIVFHRWPTNMGPRWRVERIGVILTDIALVALVGTLCYTIGWERYLLIQLPATALTTGSGLWLFYVQHQFEGAYWRPSDEWNFEEAGLDGSSYYRMPRILQWFTGNIGIHHVHHLSSKIPNYRLEEAMRETPELQSPTELTLLSSLKCGGLKLWDEERRKLVGFRDIAPAA